MAKATEPCSCKGLGSQHWMSSISAVSTCLPGSGEGIKCLPPKGQFHSLHVSQGELWPLTCDTLNHLGIASCEKQREDSESSPAGETTGGGSLTRGGGQEEKMQVCGWREVREGEGTGDA